MKFKKCTCTWLDREDRFDAFYFKDEVLPQTMKRHQSEPDPDQRGHGCSREMSILGVIIQIYVVPLLVIAYLSQLYFV
jgi:hypothetical protein